MLTITYDKYHIKASYTLCRYAECCYAVCCGAYRRAENLSYRLSPIKYYLTVSDADKMKISTITPA